MRGWFLLLALVLLWTPVTAQSPEDADPLDEEQRAWLEEHAPVRVGLMEDAAPRSFRDDGGTWRGRDVEMLQLAALKAGVDVELISVGRSPEEAAHHLREGNVDTTGAFLDQPELTDFAVRTDEWDSMLVVFVTSADHPEIQTQDDLTGRVSTLQGTPLEDLLREEYPHLEYVPTASPGSALSDLARGDLDAYMGPVDIIGHHLQVRHIQGVRTVGGPVESLHVGFWVRENETELLAILEEGRSLITAREAALIEARWLGFTVAPTPERERVPDWLVWVVPLGVVVLGLLALGVVVLRRQVRLRTRQLGANRAFLAAVLDHGPPSYVKDGQGRLLLVNDALERLLERPEHGLLGQTEEEAGVELPGGDERREAERRVAQSGRDEVVPELSWATDGQQRWYQLALAPLAGRSPMGEARLLGVLTDVTAERERRMGLEVAVESREQDLAHVNKELRAFVYTVSHDLRAPLRHLDGYSQALLEDHADDLDDEGRAYLDRIRNASQRMDRLLDAMLHLSRASRRPMQVQDVDLSEVAQEVRDDLVAEDPERPCVWEIEEGLGARGDPHLLTLVLQNLLGNAWKYTSENADARISFFAQEEDEEVVYTVQDNGVGFDPARMEELWAPFKRLEPEERFRGTGIGLATVQRAVARHGGRVWAEGWPGEGAAFHFTLPKDDVALQGDLEEHIA